MASPPELSLDCKPHSYSMLLKSFGDQTEQTQKLEEFLSHLEEERVKIDAFKRELPLCMQLLTNAVETSRQQLQAYRANQGGSKPMLEEFIPIKNSTCEVPDKTSSMSSDKATWMTTAQLWSPNETKSQSNSLASPKEADMIGLNFSPKLGLDNRPRNAGAFHPFSKERNQLCQGPTLALSSVDKEMEDKKCSESENGFSCVKREIHQAGKLGNGGMAIEQGKGAGNPVSPDGQTTNINSNGAATNTSNNGNNATNGQTHRKARRCWSPDLHRRFVSALQMLGGSQVATPKQIRELMKVDGLTNDEVKSHLQKYRLHTRRPSPSPQTAAAPAPQVVVLGGIWVPPEYATAAAAAHGGPSTLYGAHPASHAQPIPPPHFCAAPPVTQDFYTAAAAAAAAAATPSPPPPRPHQQMHHHSLHQQLHVYKATPHGQSSPESDDRSTRDRSDSMEDGKSESSSWKGESAENGGERKGMGALREDGEESNGSEITLKF